MTLAVYRGDEKSEAKEAVIYWDIIILYTVQINCSSNTFDCCTGNQDIFLPSWKGKNGGTLNFVNILSCATVCLETRSPSKIAFVKKKHAA